MQVKANQVYRKSVGVGLANLALRKLGIDAPLRKCNVWLGKRETRLNEDDFEQAKSELEGTSRSRTMRQIQDYHAEELLKTEDGRHAIRRAITNLNREQLLDLFGVHD
jgi:hypothetical protein